ncbi:MAG: phosphatase PAP2 family protein [Pseudomonadota bacterium]
MSAMINYLDELEIGVCRTINQVGNVRPIRGFFALASRLGDWYFWVGMGAVLFAIQGASALPAIGVMIVTFLVGLGIYRFLKTRLVRERPFVADQGIRCGTAPLDRYSFPSGHTLHAVCFAILLPQCEPVLTLVCAPFATIVAMSRVVLGLHYPTDVIVGAAIGASLALLAQPFI